MKWSNVKLTSKMILGYGIIFLLMFVFTGGVVVILNVITDVNDDLIYGYEIQSSLSIQKNISESIIANLNSLDDFVTDEDLEFLSKQTTTLAGVVHALVVQLDSNAYEGIHSAALKTLHQNILSFKNKLALINDENIDEEIGRISIAASEVSNEVGDLIKRNNNHIAVLNASKDKSIKDTRTRIRISILSISFILIFILSVFVRSVRKMVRNTMGYAEQIASGDLYTTIRDVRKDEFGLINQALERIRENFNRTVASIDEMVESIVATSTELSDNSQKISDGANSQAATAEEISAAMEQISETFGQNSKNASETSTIAENAFSGLKTSSSTLNETVAVIRDIADKNSVISEIAYQTKILSLNASVEAARAGDAGRGFSVVADEVKKLAEDSQDSASEVADVSHKGVEMTVRSADMISSIVPEIEKTSKLVNEIAKVSTEQSTTILQISASIQAMNDVIQQNASSSVELASSSEELLYKANVLKQQLDLFITSEEDLNHRMDHTNKLDSAGETENMPQEELEIEIQTEEYIKPEISFTEALADDMEEPVVAPEETREQIYQSVFEKRESTIEKIKDLEAPHAEASEKSENRNISKEQEVQKPRQSKGVRINLSNNDDMDSDFEKIK